MKKAVILVGGKQYLVAEKETLRVDLLPAGTKEQSRHSYSKGRKSFSQSQNARSKGRQSTCYSL